MSLLVERTVVKLLTYSKNLLYLQRTGKDKNRSAVEHVSKLYAHKRHLMRVLFVSKVCFYQ